MQWMEYELDWEGEKKKNTKKGKKNKRKKENSIILTGNYFDSKFRASSVARKCLTRSKTNAAFMWPRRSERGGVAEQQ